MKGYIEFARNVSAAKAPGAGMCGIAMKPT